MSPKYNISKTAGAPMIGRNHTSGEETRGKMASSKAERKHTSGEETRAMMSSLKIGEKKNPMFGKKGEANPMFGKQHSDETRAKMSVALQGKKT